MTNSSSPDSDLKQMKATNTHVNEPSVMIRDPPLRRAAYLIILLWGLNAGETLLLPLLIAGLCAFLMAPLQRFYSNRLHLPQTISIFLSVLTLLSPIVLIGFLLVNQVQSLIHDFPQLAHSAQESLSKLAKHPILSRFDLSGHFNPSEVVQKAVSSAGKGIELIMGGIAAVANFGSQGILILVFSVLMLSSKKHLRNSAERIVAQSKLLQSASVLDQVVELMQRFLIGRILIMLIIGSLAAIVLLVCQVQYSIFLGALVGVTTIIPAVGFALALIPTLIVAAVTGHSLVSLIVIIGALIVVNTLDNYYLTPKLVGNRVNINALACFVGLYAGGLLWGVWGMLLSVPLLGMLRIVLNAIPSLEPWGELLSDIEHTKKPGFVLKKAA